MKSIALISQKGGVGKTTLAISLAVEAGRRYKKTSIFDLDSQSSASFWINAREKTTPLVKSVEPGGLKYALGSARENGCELAIVDSPPFAKDIGYEAASEADLILIPVKPAVFDLASITKTLDLTTQFGKKAVVILSLCPIQGREIEDTKETIKHLGAKVSPILIHNRIAYSRSQQKGLAVQEYEPGGKASNEIKRLFKYVEKECADEKRT